MNNDQPLCFLKTQKKFLFNVMQLRCLSWGQFHHYFTPVFFDKIPLLKSHQAKL